MRRIRHCNRLPAAHSRLVRQATVPHFIATSMVSARAGLSGNAAVQRMASDMREAAYREGGLTIEGMELLGWTRSQINALCADARTLANAQAVMTS